VCVYANKTHVYLKSILLSLPTKLSASFTKRPRERVKQTYELCTSTRWFKYDRDWLCVNKSQFVPVIFKPSCNFCVSYQCTLLCLIKWRCWTCKKKCVLRKLETTHNETKYTAGGFDKKETVDVSSTVILPHAAPDFKVYVPVRTSDASVRKFLAANLVRLQTTET
jgi:hypothetical protein